MGYKKSADGVGREEKKRQTRHAFFQATLALCASEQGFGSISLRKVTREVGVVPTTFYRHFQDMDELGKALVDDELGGALQDLRDRMQLGKRRTFDHQIAKSVQLFFNAIDESPSYWHFIASERFGGTKVLRDAIADQIDTFAKAIGEDLALQPPFAHINANDRYLLAHAGVNLSFSWIMDWLDLNRQINQEQDTKKQSDLLSQRQRALHRCTRQTQMLYYGAYNWKSSEKTVVN